MVNQLPDWYREDDTRTIYRFVVGQGFPTVEQLRHGLMLGTIAQALSLTTGSDDGESWWDRDEGGIYTEDNPQGERWALAFAEAGAVAVFYSTESARNPFPEGSPPYNQAQYFAGMPESLRATRDQALRWMFDFDFEVGGANAVITAAMWANGDRFAAIEPWEDVYKQSGEMCAKHFLPLEVALIEWQENCGLDERQVAVLRALYERKVAAGDAIVDVLPDERRAFIRSTNPPGVQALRDELAAVAITF